MISISLKQINKALKMVKENDKKNVYLFKLKKHFISIKRFSFVKDAFRTILIKDFKMEYFMKGCSDFLVQFNFKIGDGI